MRFFAKTSLIYLLLSIPVLIFAGVICFFLITSEVRESNNELLLNRKCQIEKFINQNDTVSLFMIIRSGEAIISPQNESVKIQNKFSDTLINDFNENEPAPNHVLVSTVNTNRGKYLIRVWRSTLEFNELYEGIAIALAIILVMLFLIFFFINWWATRTLWKPFYQTVESLKSFRANSDERPSFQITAIKEFSVLNKSVQAMMDKMIADFNSQKQFTENASHEMQTPLAVIRTKMDLLIQSENLGKKETDLILSIDDACTKLGRLNKSLLLLTKIENRQFKESEKVWLNGVLKNALELFSEHIAFQNIHLTIDIEDDVFISINPDLSFILISNLMQNAIRHNYKGGEVKINLNKERLSMSNTSCALPIISSKLFERFQKSSTSTESLGLGLAIAKEIADASNLLLEYKYDSNRHKFSVLFNKI